MGERVVRRRQARESEARLDAEVTRISGVIDRTFAQLSQLAAEPGIFRYDPPAIERRLRALAGSFAQSELLTLGLPGGNVIASDGTRYNVRDRYYWPLLKAGERHVTNAVISRGSGAPMLGVTVPRLDSAGRFVGAVGVSLRITDVLEGVQQARAGVSGFAVLADEGGRALTSGPDRPSDLMTFVSDSGTASLDPAIRALASEMREGARGSRAVQVGGRRYTATYAPVPLTRWTLALVTRDDETLADLRRILSTMVLMFLLLMVGGGVAAIFLQRSIVGPIQSLRDAHGAVAAGELGRLADVQVGGELGALAVSFNHMSAQLASEHEALLREMQSRAEAERRLRQSSKMQALGTLAGGIAHDFNNILMPILGSAELLRESFPPEHPDRELVEDITTAAQRARALVQQILAVARQRESQRVSVAVAGVVEEALDLLRAVVPANITIRTEISASLPPVNADPTQLHSIVMNLCTNAMQAMEEQGGTLLLRLAAPSDDEVVLEVSDTGPGIATEALEHIFDPFFTTKAPGKGTGLGLAVVDGIVRELGGTITAVAPPTGGARFRVRLPATRAPVVSPPDSRTPVPRRPLRIIVVDDEPAVAGVLARLLGTLGHKPETMPDDKALGQLAGTSPPPDLLITDYNMPAINGLDLATAVHARHPQLPIVLLTGYADARVPERSERSGIRAVVEKPWTRQRLAEVLRDLFPDHFDSVRGA